MAGRYDLRVDAGATYDQPFVWCNPKLDGDGKVMRDEDGVPIPDLDNPIDLTGKTARLQIRRNLTATDVALTLTTENDGIELGGVNGTVRIVMTDEQTATLRSGVYDLELIDDTTGKVSRFMQGRVRVSAEVTR